MSIDYKDIPDSVWELLADLVRNPADRNIHIGEDAWMIAVENGLVDDDSQATFAGIAALRWYQEMRDRPADPLLPDGTKVELEDVPAAYREGGQPDGAPSGD